MPLSGVPLKSFEISTDATVGNYEELKAEIVQAMRYNPGRRTSRMPRGGQAVYVQAASDPSFTLTYEPDAANNGSIDVIMLAAAGQAHAFKAQLADSSAAANDGYQVTGVCLFEDGETTFDQDAQTVVSVVILRPALGYPVWRNAKVLT